MQVHYRLLAALCVTLLGAFGCSGNGSKTPGETCGADYECATGKCLQNCCTNVCKYSIGDSACGRPYCDADGGCVLTFSAGTACTLCSGSSIITAGQCSSSGTCMGTAAPCPNNTACLTDGTACQSTCTATEGCAAGFVCDTQANTCNPAGATTGGTTTGGTTTAGTTGGTTGGTTTGGSTTGGTTTGGTTTGGTTGGACGPGATWQGDVCVVTSCTGAPDQALCALTAGGQGQCIGGSCLAPIDFNSDSANCGYYGAACPAGSVCTRSVCPGSRCSTNPTCPVGTTCADVSRPNVTPSGVCVAATCGATDGIACLLNGGVGTCCGSTCQDPQHDPLHCGGCGVVCLASEFCNLGTCQPKPDCTAAGTAPGARCNFVGGVALSCCGGACIDLTADSANCGSCGLHCVPGMACANNNCAFASCASNGCDAGLDCIGSGHCVLTSCAAGDDGLACHLSGNIPGVCCASVCSDLQSGLANCGACGRACGEACIAGVCQPARPVDCATNPGAPIPGSPVGVNNFCCDGAVTDVSTDPSNCLSCGWGCAENSTCIQGNCHLVDGGTSICGTNNPCPAGETCHTVFGSPKCLGSTCSAANQGQSCALGTNVGTCCDGVCADTNSDSNNCHFCGWVCPTGGTCTTGPFPCVDSPDGGSQVLCTAGSCAAGFNCSNNVCVAVSCAGRADREICSYGPGTTGTCCNGACVDLQQSGNCGACGSDCPAGICVPNCLTQPTSDCAAACPADAICVKGQCTTGLCLASGVSCATVSGGVGVCCGDKACADLSNDADSCGSCNVQCPSGQTCTAGVCSGGVPECAGRASGYCTLTAGGTGVCCGGGCVDTATDANNCGACGTACGTLTCTVGVCS